MQKLNTSQYLLFSIFVMKCPYSGNFMPSSLPKKSSSWFGSYLRTILSKLPLSASERKRVISFREKPWIFTLSYSWSYGKLILIFSIVVFLIMFSIILIFRKLQKMHIIYKYSLMKRHHIYANPHQLVN